MQYNRIMQEAALITWAKFGIRFENHSETVNELKLYISVPEHSEHKDKEGKEMAGMHLAKRFKTVFQDMGVKQLTVLAKVRKDEYWTTADELAAEVAMKKALRGSQW